jgi:cell division protein ZapA (FtsZ GTPase activity inhibitor)
MSPKDSTSLLRVSVKIAGQEFGMKVRPGEEEGIKQVVDDINRRVREFQQAGIGSTLRALSMAAFQVGYELAEERGSPKLAQKDADKMANRLSGMIDRIDDAIK